jgi:hypothetical protein
MPEPRTEVAGTMSHGRAVVVGGLLASGAASDRADAYDPYRSRWDALPSLPVALHHTTVAELDHRLYVAGGYTANGTEWVASARVWSLGLGDTTWREEPPLPEPRAAHALVRIKDTLIAAGGVVGGSPTASTVVFRLGAGWQAGPPLARAREHLAAAVARGRAYVIAGRVGGDNFTDVESWDGVDPAGWQREPALNDSRGGIGADSIGDTPCVAGGEQARGTIASIECLRGGVWTRVARLTHPRHGIAVVATGAQLRVIGGGRRPGLTVSADHEVFVF